MTLSLSSFMFSCVFFLSLGVCSAFFLVLKSFNSVSIKFKECLKFKGVFQGGFKEVFRVFTESFKGVSSV